MTSSYEGKNSVRYFSGRASLGLGVTLILFGCIAVAAQIVILKVYNEHYNSVSQGIWCGVAFVVCGMFGIVAGKRRTLPWIITHMIFCILACLFAGAIIALSALSLGVNSEQPYNYQSWPCSGQLDSLPTPQSYNTGNYYSTGSYESVYTSYYTSGITGYWTSYYTASVGSPITLGNGGLLTPYNSTTAWVQYMTGYLTGYYTSYYNEYSGGYYAPTGCYVMNVPWVVQFAMNLLMGCIGIICAILTVVAATLSCAPVCCNPDKHEHQGQGWKAPLMPPVYIETPPYTISAENPHVSINLTDPEDGSKA